jgi:hypothetical protein
MAVRLTEFCSPWYSDCWGSDRQRGSPTANDLSAAIRAVGAWIRARVDQVTLGITSPWISPVRKINPTTVQSCRGENR